MNTELTESARVINIWDKAKNLKRSRERDRHHEYDFQNYLVAGMRIAFNFEHFDEAAVSNAYKNRIKTKKYGLPYLGFRDEDKIHLESGVAGISVSEISDELVERRRDLAIARIGSRYLEYGISEYTLDLRAAKVEYPVRQRTINVFPLPDLLQGKDYYLSVLRGVKKPYFLNDNSRVRDFTEGELDEFEEIMSQVDEWINGRELFGC